MSLLVLLIVFISGGMAGIAIMSMFFIAGRSHEGEFGTTDHTSDVYRDPRANKPGPHSFVR